MSAMTTYKSIRELVISKIRSGKYKPGERIDSFRSIAVSQGTSTLTVARAISHLEAEGYIVRNSDRKYYVSDAASSGPSKRSIGILLRAIPTRLAEAEAAVANDSLALLHSLLLSQDRSVLTLAGLKRRDGYQDLIPVQEIAEHALDGLIAVDFYNLMFLGKLSAVSKALVAMDVDASDVAVDSVFFDNFGSALALAEGLISSGARRILYIGGPFPPERSEVYWHNYDPAAKERFEGWRLAMLSHGLTPDVELARALAVEMQTRDATGLERAIRKMIRDGGRFDGLICEDIQAARGLLEAVGVRPGEMLVGGWTSCRPGDDVSRWGDWVAACDYADLAKAAVEVLMRRLNDPTAHVARRACSPRILTSSKRSVA